MAVCSNRRADPTPVQPPDRGTDHEQGECRQQGVSGGHPDIDPRGDRLYERHQDRPHTRGRGCQCYARDQVLVDPFDLVASRCGVAQHRPVVPPEHESDNHRGELDRCGVEVEGRGLFEPVPDQL